MSTTTTNIPEMSATPTDQRSRSPAEAPALKRRRHNTAVEEDAPAPLPQPPELALPNPMEMRGRGWDIPLPDLGRMTRQEARAYVMRHLEEGLARLERPARFIERVTLNPEDIQDSDVADWPAARLYLIKCGLRGLTGTNEEQYQAASTWALGVCRHYLLTGGQSRDVACCVQADDQQSFDAETVDLAIGFLTEDHLLAGTTLMDLWMWSPFEALRAAPPLPEEKEQDPTGWILAAVLVITAYFWVLAWFVDTRCSV